MTAVSKTARSTEKRMEPPRKAWQQPLWLPMPMLPLLDGRSARLQKRCPISQKNNLQGGKAILSPSSMNKIQSLLNTCETSLQKNEYNMRPIRGVQCSCSDVETIMLYCETIQQHGTYKGYLMPPRCAVADVLVKYDLRED